MSFVNVTSDSVCPAVTGYGTTTPRATIIASVMPTFTTNLPLNMAYLSTRSSSDGLRHRGMCRIVPTAILEQSGGRSENHNLNSVGASHFNVGSSDELTTSYTSPKRLEGLGVFKSIQPKEQTERHGPCSSSHRATTSLCYA